MAFDRAIAIITIACEASNQPHLVRVGVAASLLNRLKLQRYGATIAAVCLRRMQYSEWNADRVDNVNLERVAAMADEDPVMIDCGQAFDEAAAGADPTNGATHFYVDGTPVPIWARPPAARAAQLGALIFWKNVA